MFRSGVKALWVWIGVVVLGVCMVVVFMFATGLMKKWTADFRGDVAANERVQARGEYRIAAYDKFFADCASIQTLQQQLESVEEEIESTTDEKRIGDLRTVQLALNNQLNGAVNRYNVDARREATVGQFRDSDLPYNINIGETVTCGS